jgi:hypothetical protein
LFEYAWTHAWIADRSQDDRIVAQEFLEHGRGQHLTRSEVTVRPQVIGHERKRDSGCRRHVLEHAESRFDDLGTHSIATQYCNRSHVRSSLIILCLEEKKTL